MQKELLPVTVTLITRNEGPRIAQAIESVKGFAREVIVIDSESTDETAQIAKSLGAQVHIQNFLGFGQQKNYAHKLASSEWVLNIDADERVTPELENEIREFLKSSDSGRIQGAFLPRKTWYLDRWVMHGGWYPNYLMRFVRKENAQWTEPTIHEELKVQGESTHFKIPLEHYSFPTQRSHILKNVDYAAHACQGLVQKGRTAGLLDLLFRPFWKFLDGYVIKAGFLDGRAGLFIAFHSAYATFLRYTYLYEYSSQNSRSRQ